LRAYLDGTRLVSESNWRGASEEFDRAIAADSTFWLAHMGKQFALGWEVGGQDSALDARIRAHRHELPERERLMVEAGMADSATQYLERLRAIVARYPDYGLAQWYITDELVHSGAFYDHAPAEILLEGERTLQIHPATSSHGGTSRRLRAALGIRRSPAGPSTFAPGRHSGCGTISACICWLLRTRRLASPTACSPRCPTPRAAMATRLRSAS
jgi:hypothetical protein